MVLGNDRENAAGGMKSPTYKGLVDAETGFVGREAFTSDEIYADETSRIFDRSWIYLGHESEIPNAGDYVTRTLGSAPVVVARTDAGDVHAVLNSCRHRGAKLCRDDSGRAKKFVCPYHGWSYANNGSLITTTFDHHFPEDTDFSQFDLVAVPRLETKFGLIFGSWNADVPPLDAYLNDMGWYLEAFFDRTPLGMEVLSPPHRWQVAANWKIGALNFIGDSQHIGTTHIGPLTLDSVRSAREGFTQAGQQSFQVVMDEGHGCTLTYLGPGMPAENYRTHDDDLSPLFAENLSAEQVRMLHHLRVCVGTVFPNLSIIETQVARGEKAVILRLWQPTGPRSMEVLSWVFAEKEANNAYKQSVLRRGFHNFGAAGVFEQDDMELWISATEASNNPIAAQYPYSFHTSLPYQDTPDTSYGWPGRAYRPSDTEVAQFEFMRQWDRRMRDADNPAATAP